MENENISNFGIIILWCLLNSTPFREMFAPEKF